MKQTHEILRELRENRNYRQEYIARYLGTTQQTYSNYELGLREIPVRHIVKLTRLYHVSADYLLRIDAVYQGSSNLALEFAEGMSLHDIIFDIQALDIEKRKILIQFMRFLRTQK